MGARCAAPESCVRQLGSVAQPTALGDHTAGGAFFGSDPFDDGPR